MNIDSSNPVVALCAAGMAIEGNPLEALELFEQAWAARRDDYDACIAAHFLARHQPTADATLHWNLVAIRHAEAVSDGRALEFMASLYLNLGDARMNAGDYAMALDAAQRARASLLAVPAGGYRDFVEYGIHRLEERLGSANSPQDSAGLRLSTR
jgi:tetratricopeptide (TPR) repeat protein